MATTGIADAIVAPFKATEQILKAIDSIGRQLDGERSVVVIVENTTPYNLEFVSAHHEHGGFDVTPSATLPKQSTAVSPPWTGAS